MFWKRDPNNSNSEAAAVSGALPLAFNGILQAEGDVDFFSFTAKKDQAFQFRVFANSMVRRSTPS